MQTVFHEMLDRLENAKPSGQGYIARCPAHDDHKNSLSVALNQDNRILLKCHAGCDTEKVVAALGYRMADLFPPKEKPTPKAHIIATYDYTDENGVLLFQAVRKSPKAFSQRRPNGDNEWEWSLGDVRRVLYRLPELLSAVAQSRRIYIAEGEKDVDALYKIGLAATTNPMGAGKWRKEYSVFLRGAEVVILPDNDEAGRNHAKKVAQMLAKCARIVRILNLPDLPPSGDVSDWLAKNGTAEALEAMADALFPSRPADGETPSAGFSTLSAENADKKPQAEYLMEIGQRAKLFHSDREEGFARFEVKEHKQTWSVRSRAFRDWISRQFYQEYEKVASEQAMDDALRVLEGICRFDGKRHALSVRMARDTNQVIWIDLTDAEWRAVQVTANGWEVVREPPILFRRYALSEPQPLPQSGGTLDELRAFLNVKNDNAWYQLVTWLIAGLIPEIAHPVLVVHGEQGSAKSTLLRLLALLLDPSKTPLRSEPRDIAEWTQAADHSWLVTLDNVTNLPGWLSDALCRAVTGDAFSKRQLYTDSEDIILVFRRVIALTGIEVVVQRADLLDRSILLALEPIPPDRRRLETEVLAAFEAVRPRLFGALLDTLVRVLSVLPTVYLSHLPRMADFTKIGVAVERVLGWPEGAFLNAYASNISEQHAESLSSSVVGQVVCSFMDEREEWKGTVKELLEALSTHAGAEKIRDRDWPKTPKKLSGQIKRIGPNLRGVGIWVFQQERTRDGYRLMIRKGSPQEQGTEQRSPSSQSSPQSENGVNIDQMVMNIEVPEQAGNTQSSHPFRSEDEHGECCERSATSSEEDLTDEEEDGPEVMI